MECPEGTSDGDGEKKYSINSHGEATETYDISSNGEIEVRCFLWWDDVTHDTYFGAHSIVSKE